MSANGRLLDVNAFTTLDYVDATARGHDRTDHGPAVVDVRVPEDDPDAVILEIELDWKSLDHVVPHADRITLSVGQARTLADALVAATGSDDEDRGGRRAR